MKSRMKIRYGGMVQDKTLDWIRVCTEEKTINITSLTYTRIRNGEDLAIKELFKSTQKYPNYHVVVNDNYYLKQLFGSFTTNKSH